MIKNISHVCVRVIEDYKRKSMSQQNYSEEEYSEEQNNTIFKWQEKIKRGILRMIILRMFQEQTTEGEPILLNGTSIRDRIEQRTPSKWSPSPGSVYPILSEMESDGLIELQKSDNKKNRDYYITPFGRHVHQSIMEEVMFSHDSTPHSAQFFRSEGFNEMMKAKCRGMDLKMMKLQYERHRAMSEYLENELKKKIINDPEI